MDEFSSSVADFQAEALRRKEIGDPKWMVGARAHPAVVKSVQRFQVGG